MTKERIIEILEGAKDRNGDVPFEIAVKAINKMAIEALQQTDRDTISRQAAIDTIEAEKLKRGDYMTSSYVGYEFAENAIRNMPSAQPVDKDIHVPCNDTISRQAAIDAVFKDDRNTTIKQRLDALPSAQPDLSEYSDKLWRSAYERGKAEAQAEIIRCKDCKYHRQNYSGDSWCGHPKGLGGFELMPTDFCSKAERRTDDD